MRWHKQDDTGFGGEGGGTTEGIQKNGCGVIPYFLTRTNDREALSFLRILVSFGKYIIQNRPDRLLHFCIIPLTIKLLCNTITITLVCNHHTFVLYHHTCVQYH